MTDTEDTIAWTPLDMTTGGSVVLSQLAPISIEEVVFEGWFKMINPDWRKPKGISDEWANASRIFFSEVILPKRLIFSVKTKPVVIETAPGVWTVELVRPEEKSLEEPKEVK